MRVLVSFKLKSILALLIAMPVMDVLALFFSTRLDLVVHGDLYRYGLQANYEWIERYWSISHLLLISWVIAAIIAGLLMASFAIYARKRGSISRGTCNSLIAARVGLNVFSLFLFTRLDYIVHHDLYFYGLQSNSEWYTTYWLYAGLMLASVSIAIAAAVASATLINLSARKTIEVNPARVASSILVATGVLALVVSVIYVLSIFAFIGLGLLFWGIIFGFISTKEYVKKVLLEAIVPSQIATLNEIVQTMKCEGTAIYLPPKYFRNPGTNKVYIPKPKGVMLPKPEHTQDQDAQSFIDLIENPPAVLLTPPGAELAKLFEKTLGTDFTRADLKYLRQNLPKLLIEDLEITQNFDLEIENNRVRVKIENSLFDIPQIESDKPSGVYSPFGSPLSGAIACVIAKTTGKPVIIEKQQLSENGRRLTIDYLMLDEEQTEQ